MLQNQFKLIELKPYDGYKIESIMDERSEIEPFLKALSPDVIIIDHYGLDLNWETLAKKYCKKLIAIDDLNRKHDAHAILDQNFYIDPPTNYKAEHLFIGPEFCLLNSSFNNVQTCEIKEKVSNLLIFFGGADIHSQTLRVVKLLKDFKININVVCGSQNKDIKELQGFKYIKLHVDINYTAKLMSESDLFIGAGGTTTWERAKLGLPSLVISVARNQEEICQNLHQKNVINYLGVFDKISDELISHSVSNLIQDYNLRLKFNDNSLKLEVGDKLNEFISYIQSDI